jgi:hypothetical protein
MFSNYLDEQSQIKIGGAPSWYMQPVDNQICTFSHKKGKNDIEIDIVKDKSRFKMIKKINNTIDIVIYENTKNITNKKEKAVVNKFRIDDNLPLFVKQNLVYSKIIYEDEIKTTFVRSCIKSQIVLDYQILRLQEIKKEVTKEKAKSAFDDLDKNGITNDKNNPFFELP